MDVLEDLKTACGYADAATGDERVAGHAPKANDDSRMLDVIVRIVEHRANTVDFRPGRLTDHLRQSVGADHFEIIIE